MESRTQKVPRGITHSVTREDRSAAKDEEQQGPRPFVSKPLEIETMTLDSIPRCRCLIIHLMDRKKLSESSMLAYILKGVIYKNAIPTREGIKCICGCNHVYSITKFEVHAGSKHKRGSEHIYLHDGPGKSLAVLRDESDWSLDDNGDQSLSSVTYDQNNSTCDFCGLEGELLCCRTLSCPAVLHVKCFRKQIAPDGEGYCQKCTCSECGEALSSRSPHRGNNTIPPPPVFCEQCGDKYHMECLLQASRLKYSASFQWFCSDICEQISEILQELVKLTRHPSPSRQFTLLRWSSERDMSFLYDTQPMDDERTKMLEEFEAERAAKANKIFYALALLSDSFQKATYLDSQPDLIRSISYNYTSAGRNAILDHKGFYVVLLERDGHIVTVATVRIHGQMLAEMPFIATCRCHRRQGFFSSFMNGLQEMLKQLEVQRLVVQSPPQSIPMWIAKQFFRLEDSDLKKIILKTNYLKLRGTSLLYKDISIG